MTAIALALALLFGGPAPRPAEDDTDVAVRLAVAAHVADSDTLIYEWTGPKGNRDLFVGAIRADECYVGWTWYRGQWSGLLVHCG